jgi:AraC-like DNA-binding protein
MKSIFYQILNHPHQGGIGRIYLESKALELIALKFEQILQPMCSPKRNIPMVPDDCERICQARDLLVNKLRYPPSLGELAAQVGMSHARLNRGFRKVFGCTAFEYLRRERLSYARMLIEEKPADLTWVAFESGFCSSSHFAASFLKAYGIRPSEYRKSLSMANAVNKA